jgi:hypothetical protein
MVRVYTHTLIQLSWAQLLVIVIILWAINLFVSNSVAYMVKHHVTCTSEYYLNISVLRVWDVLLFDGNRVMLFRIALALLEFYGTGTYLCSISSPEKKNILIFVVS